MNDPLYTRAVALRDTLFVLSGKWVRGGYYAKVFFFVVGLILIYCPVGGDVGVAILGLVAAGADVVIWWGGTIADKAQSIHRKLDLTDSLGWPIAAHELSDYAATLDNPRSLPRKGNYFASTKPPGPERALENLVESSWWSKHLAKIMAKRMWKIIVILVIVCIASLVWTVLIHPASEQAANMVQVVLGTLLVLFSFNLLFVCLGFQEFCAQAGEICKKAIAMWDAPGALDEREVLKLWADYHLARTAAPKLPTQIWQKKQEKLNTDWADYFGEKFSKPRSS
jgi:hypothetical protein